jgi:DNA modification methylase
MNLEILDLLPVPLRYELIDDITAKVNRQSALALKQLTTKKILEQQTRRGARTDLISRATCTPDGVQVRSRRESCTEKVADLFGEGAGAVRRRIYVYERAQANPAKYGKFLKQMDDDKSPYRAFDLMRAAERMERIVDESAPQIISSGVLPGDLWNLGSHRLYCGDATAAVDVSRLLGGAVAHLMVTDPPYGVDYEPSWRRKIGNNNVNRMGSVLNDDRVDWSEAWKLFTGDVGYVWFADRHAAVVQTSLENHGLFVRNQIVWVKTRPVISRGHYSPQAEYCYYAVREGKTAHWEGPKSQSTVWKKIDNREDRGHGHSTQKPVECMLRPIQHNSKEGDAVYDPFVGSGTTIVAAEVSHRRCYAMELDPHYCAVAIERWQNWAGRDAVLGVTGEPYSKVMRERNRNSRNIGVLDVAAEGAC